MEVAALGLKIEGASGIEQAAISLDHLADSAGKAERSGGRLSESFAELLSIQRSLLSSINGLDSSVKTIASGLSKSAAASESASGAMAGLASAQEKGKVATDTLGSSASKTSTAIDNLSKEIQEASADAGKLSSSASSAKVAIDSVAKTAVSASGGVGKLADSAVKAEKATTALDPASRKSSQSVQQLGKSSASTAGSMNNLASTAKKLGGVLVAAFSVSKVIQYADAWSDMQSRVGAVIGDMDAAGSAMGRILQIANASYSPLEQTAEVFSRNVATFRDLGKSADEAADFTEAVNNALVVTATRGDDAAVVVNSLSRSLATGKLDADAFDTIVSRSPRTLKAVADQMGVTTIELRKLAQEGKVTSEVIAAGLVGSLDQLKAEAAEMPATMGDAFVRVGNNLTALVGTYDQVTGASGALASAIIELSDTALEMATSEDVIAGLLAWQGALQAIGQDFIELDRIVSGFTSNTEEDASSIGFSFAEIPANIRAAIQIATVEIASFIDAQLNGIQALAAAVKALPDGPSAAVDAFNAVRSQMAALGDARMQSIEAILQERDAIVNGARDAAKAYKEGTRQTLEMNGAVVETARIATNASQKNASAIENEISALERAAKVWGMSAGEVKIYDLTLKGASATQIEYARSLIATVEGLEAQKKAEEEAREARERAGKAFETVSRDIGASGSGNPEIDRLNIQFEERREIIAEALATEYLSQQEHDAAMIALEEQTAATRKQIMADYTAAQQAQQLQSMSAIVSITQSQIAQMQGLFEEGSAIGKAFFVASQALAAANAIIQGFQSAMAIRVAYAQMAAMTANPLLIGVGEVHANVAQAMGFATAGMIAGQTVAGFQQGGYTGNMGVSDVAGVVHGREYVFDAAATARIGVPTLEAIRAGRPINSSGGISNGSGSDMSQPITIAPQVVVNGDPDKATIARIEKATADGAKLAYQQISNDLATGRGNVSKSLQAGYGVSRRKG